MHAEDEAVLEQCHLVIISSSHYISPSVAIVQKDTLSDLSLQFSFQEPNAEGAA